jgi:DNA-binding NarL/FixJ family response regulator
MTRIFRQPHEGIEHRASPMSRIVIVDDHAIVRRGLLLIISEAHDLEVVDVSSTDELVALLRSDQIDLVVMSVSFAGSGADMLRFVKAEFPNLPVLMFNSQADELAAMRALRAGASGYIEKESTPEELLTAVRRLTAGGQYVSHTIAQKIAAELARGGEGEKLHERLSRRELEVFRLLGAGKSVGEIANRLKLSVKTVSTHRTRILEKTRMRNNADIIRYAILNGLII